MVGFRPLGEISSVPRWDGNLPQAKKPKERNNDMFVQDSKWWVVDRSVAFSEDSVIQVGNPPKF